MTGAGGGWWNALLGRPARLLADASPFARVITRNRQVVAENLAYRALASLLGIEGAPSPERLLASRSANAALLQQMQELLMRSGRAEQNCQVLAGGRLDIHD